MGFRSSYCTLPFSFILNVYNERARRTPRTPNNKNENTKMNTEIKIHRAASARIERVENALYLFQSFAISRQKFIGVCRTAFNFSRTERMAEMWDADWDYCEQNRVAEAINQAKARAQGRSAPMSPRSAIAKTLSMPSDSMIVGKVVAGQMTIDEAAPICESIRHRHENTEYDALLARGVSKDDAREIIR
jgi:hypothetical protein